MITLPHILGHISVGVVDVQNLSMTLFWHAIPYLFSDISIVSLQGYTAAQLATDAVQEFLREGPLTGGTDVDIQLLEAAKTGDLDLVEVGYTNLYTS